MEQIKRQVDDGVVKVRETCKLTEIREALGSLLYVPDVRLKPKVIETLMNYLESKFSIPDYKMKVLMAFKGLEPIGFVICQIDPHYTSYGRKCGTFGWLNVKSFEACKALMKECEIFVKQNKVRKLRGPINFPKSLGGIGIQVIGQEQQMLYGVAFTDPQSRALDYLQELGYVKESQYSCLEVTHKTWRRGKEIDNNLRFQYTDLKGFIERKQEIFDLVKNSFHGILPDSSGREEKFSAFINAFCELPPSFRELKQEFDPKIHSNIPQFQEAWESYDFGKSEPFAPMAFDKTTGELVGILLGLPDLYEAWNGQPVTRANVDSAMVKKGYTGKGIFSALNNLGQLTANLHGISYYEGTTIWSNNERAVQTIFPHCKLLRKHYVVQKRA